MKNNRILFALFLIYFVFAILLNSVGTVILQVINNYGITKSSASVLEGFKDLPIAAVSFLIASFLPRLGYKKAMLAGLAIVTAACVAMPVLPSFATTKLLFFCVGVSFALVKVSVYSTLGLIAADRQQHESAGGLLHGRGVERLLGVRLLHRFGRSAVAQLVAGVLGAGRAVRVDVCVAADHSLQRRHGGVAARP